MVEKSKPKYLLTVCPPYETEKYEEINQITMGSVTYTNGFTLNSYSAYAIFNLDGNYENMSFTLGHVDGSTMRDVNINIYLDEQLVEKIEVNCEALPKEHTISLNGADQMKIELKGDALWLVYGFGNVVVY